MSQGQRIAIFGAGGLLGRGLSALLSRAHTVVPFSKDQANVVQPQAIARVLEEADADVVLNCAGFLNVDRCEKQPRESYLVNGLGAVNLARAVGSMNPDKRPLLVQFSSDFVFDGGQGCYREDDLCRPLSFYGVHKLIADEFMLHCGLREFYILRMAGLICYTAERDNFLKRMVSLAVEKPYLQIVNDLEVSIVTIEALASYVEQFLLLRPRPGLYHAVCAGTTTWYDTLLAAFRELAIDKEIRPASIAAMPNAALRPRKSDLDVSKLAQAFGGAALPHWKEAVIEHVGRHRRSYLALCAAPARAKCA